MKNIFPIFDLRLLPSTANLEILIARRGLKNARLAWTRHERIRVDGGTG